LINTYGRLNLVTKYFTLCVGTQNIVNTTTIFTVREMYTDYASSQNTLTNDFVTRR